MSKRRIAVIDSEKCDPNRCALDCIKACPVNRTGAECIVLGERKKAVGGLDKIAVIDENLCTGCGICVPPETKIACSKGLVEIKCIQEGDFVFSHKGRLKEVTKVYKRKHNGEIYKINVYGQPEKLIATKGHPVLTVIRKKSNKKDKRLLRELTEPLWRNVETLKKGDYLLVPISKEVKKMKNWPVKVKIAIPNQKGVLWKEETIKIPVNKAFLRLVGYYLSEGCASGRRLTFSFNKKETEYINDVSELIKNIFDKDVKIKKNTGAGVNVVVDSSKITQIFQNFGKGCDKKRIPSEFMFLPPELQKSIILGEWRGDGCITKRNYFNISTTSLELSFQMQQILARNGIISSIAKVKKEGKKTVYPLNIFGSSVKKMAELCEVKLQDNRNRTSDLFQIDKNYIYAPIRKIEKTLTKNFEVMNLEVKEDESYVASGVAVHNCVKRCPFKSITIINLPSELEEPVHQYGKNSFRVYKFPVSRNGVVGLVGPNGIGKSTLLNIMSGSLKPNIGDYENEKSWSEIIEFYKGHEIQSYLQELSKGEVKLSYKPQEVSKIPSHFNGTVRDLLDRANENSRVEEIAKELEITNCFDQKISEVSGGELQRIAITAAMGKEADYYFFDEPSSYLDVKQRLKMAKVIKNLGESKKVFVVEHDLAVLDYLTDYVHILYGIPGAYGVVSSLKNSRAGINEFLDGFLKAENTRIRDYSIRFQITPPSEAWKSRQKYSYGSFEKSYSKFKLKAEEGELVKGEVMGILGPNAIGKSTFMKVLAGEEKPDKEELEFSAVVSYKPQYIDFNCEGTVYELINSQEDMDMELFESEIKKIVDDLIEKKVSKLSGGELQRTAIAIALSKKCDVALLDEPSAFLDIEQRFRLSQIIKRLTEKKEITTLAIDHDILFQDLVSNRIMVFEGTPGKEGTVKKPESMADGMNNFLSSMNITFRREPDSGRPRMNKQGSQMDEEQKRENKYYYTT